MKFKLCLTAKAHAEEKNVTRMKPLPIRIKRALLFLVSIGVVAFAFAAPAAPGQLHDAAQLPDRLRLAFSHRTRYETLGNQFRTGLDGGDQALNQYTSLHLSATGKRVRAVAELVDARAWLGDSGGALDANTVDAIEPMQAYLGVEFQGLSGPFSSADLSIGRIALNVGAGRLIGRNKFRNMPNAFTGINLKLDGSNDGKLRLLYLLPHERY